MGRIGGGDRSNALTCRPFRADRRGASNRGSARCDAVTPRVGVDVTVTSAFRVGSHARSGRWACKNPELSTYSKNSANA